jgi:hypothetical protein
MQVPSLASSLHAECPFSQGAAESISLIPNTARCLGVEYSRALLRLATYQDRRGETTCLRTAPQARERCYSSALSLYNLGGKVFA